ncbi:MAG: DUF3617 family protein [Steroidobacteraceae bacterium]|jgi:hypothetical protein
MPIRRAALAVITITAVLPAASYAADPPKLKEGLWDVHGERIENSGAKRTVFAYRLCRDHAFDKAVDAQLANVTGCTTVVKKVDSGTFSSASTCTVDAMTIVSNGLTAYQSDTSTHSETHATYTPAFNGTSEETLTEDQRYLGKCPAGVKPGDTIAPNGMIRHPR